MLRLRKRVRVWWMEDLTHRRTEESASNMGLSTIAPHPTIDPSPNAPKRTSALRSPTKTSSPSTLAPDVCGRRTCRTGTARKTASAVRGIVIAGIASLFIPAAPTWETHARRAVTAVASVSRGAVGHASPMRNATRKRARWPPTCNPLPIWYAAVGTPMIRVGIASAVECMSRRNEGLHAERRGNPSNSAVKAARASAGRK